MQSSRGYDDAVANSPYTVGVVTVEGNQVSSWGYYCAAV